MLLTMVSLVPVQNAFAAAPVTSGTLQLSNVFTYGNTAYAVDYSFPSTAKVGTNLNITVTMHILSLTGTIEYITNYRIIVDVYIGTLLVQNGSVASAVNASYLYPGATWGPNNVTIPLSAGNTGLALGQSANASVKIIMQNEDYIHYFAQFVAVTEPAMQGYAGGLLIQNVPASTSTSVTGPSSGQTYLPYALLASGAVLMLLAVVFPRVARLPQGNQK